MPRTKAVGDLNLSSLTACQSHNTPLFGDTGALARALQPRVPVAFDPVQHGNNIKNSMRLMSFLYGKVVLESLVYY